MTGVSNTKDYSSVLKKAGLRVTSPRIAILNVLEEFPHSDAEFVKDKVKERLGAVSTQAVYDTLNCLTASEILRRIEPKGIRAVYEIDNGDNHHHFVCRGCEMLLDITCIKGYKPCMNPCVEEGFIVDEAEIIYWGYCPVCVDNI